MIEIRHVRSTPASKEVYEEIYESRGIRQLDSFYIYLLNFLQPKAPARLLDVSCGEGQLVKFAQRRGLFACGVDLSAAAVTRAVQEVGPGRFQVANGEALPYCDESFDYVTCLGSLEHFEHPERGAEEMARVLKPGGKALFLLPNAYGLWWCGLHVWRTGDVEDDEQPIQRYGTRAQWTRLIEGTGLKVERVVGYDRAAPRTLGDLWWYLRRPQKLLMSTIVFPLIPTNFGSSLAFRCVKAS